jgi:hypothetical protein
VYLQYAAVTKDAAQRRSWTFYEAINLEMTTKEILQSFNSLSIPQIGYQLGDRFFQEGMDIIPCDLT